MTAPIGVGLVRWRVVACRRWLSVIAQHQNHGHMHCLQVQVGVIDSMNIIIGILSLCISQRINPPVDMDNAPFVVSKCLQDETNGVEISRRMNPFYLRGDFDGDGKLDYAVLVKDRKSEKQGYAFCFTGANRKPQIVGAGHAVVLGSGKPVVDIPDFDVWGIAVSWSKRPRRDALYVGLSESHRSWFYWNGKRMIWYDM